MKKNDLIILGAALIVALVFYLILYMSRNSGDTVYVTVNGDFYAEYPLDSDTDVIIPGAEGMNNHLVIKNGMADVTEAGCPDKICVRQKAIKYDGETIACLPNKVVIGIRSSCGNGVDAVAK